MPAGVSQNSIQRLHAITRWLQAGASATSETELKHHDDECAAVAVLVSQQHDIWLDLKAAGSYIELGSPARIRALLSALTAFVHLVPRAVADFPFGSGRQQLYSTLVLCTTGLLQRYPPAASQLALSKALLCGNVLHGLSRQLSNLSDGLAPLPAALQPTVRPLPPTNTQPASTLVELLCRSLNLSLTLACSGYECVGKGPAADAEPCERRTQWRNPYDCEPDAESGGSVVRTGSTGRDAAGRTGARAGEEVLAQGAVAAPEEAVQTGGRAPALFVQELVAAFSSSGVVEHASRGMLLLAGLQQLWAEQGTGGGAGWEATAGQLQLLQHPLGQPRRAWQAAAAAFSGTYRILSTLTASPGLLDGSTTSSGDGLTPTPATAAEAEAAEAAPAHHLDPATAAPLGTAEHQLGPEHLRLLRRVLSGPCTRHLVLCMGLRTLCELDGGPTYGLPEAAGMQRLPFAVPGQCPGGEGLLVLHGSPLHNLITLLAMRPGEEGEGAQGVPGPASRPGGSGTAAFAAARSRGVAQPPGRGTRLQLTLRVARAVAAAAVRARNRGAPGGPTCAVVEPASAAAVAVQALHLAWRHVPPPASGKGGGGGGGGGRRRAALRQWAAVAAEVACSGPVMRPSLEEAQALERLGLLLGLHPSVVGPLSPEDLSALASGGRLYRGVEALVRQLAATPGLGEQEYRPSCSLPLDCMAAACAFFALASADYTCSDCCVAPLGHLLLVPAAELRAGGNSGGGVGEEELGLGAAAAAAAAPPRVAAASLAVALGKLLRRCEAQLAATITLGRDATSVGTDMFAHAVLLVLSHLDTLCCLHTCPHDGGGVGEQCGAGRGRCAQGAAEAGGGGDGSMGQWRGAGEGRLGGVPGQVKSVEVWKEEKGQAKVNLRGVHVGRREEEDGQERKLMEQVRVCAYGAWRWLPALASLARRTAAGAGGYSPLAKGCKTDAVLAWGPLMVWVQRLCLAYLQRSGGAVGEREAAAGAGVQGPVGGVGSDGAPCAVCGRGHGSSSCCGEGSGGRWCGCWRAFLLRDLGAVELVGMALRELVPALLAVVACSPMQHEELGGTREAEVLRDVARACVLLAAVFPDEVAGAAWGPRAPCLEGPCRDGREPAGGCQGGGGGGELGLGAGAWATAGLAALAEKLQRWENAHPVIVGLRALGEWAEGRGEACVRPSAEQRAVLAEAAEGLWRQSNFQSGVQHLPPLCELRALLRVCSNPGCVVLPPPGQTEAEAGAGGGRLEACPGGCGAAWYCRRECKAEHWRAGHAEVCRGI